MSINNYPPVAYQTGMIQRKRKFQAQDLVSLCMFLGQTISSESLVSLCTKINEATGTCISAEALNKRWNEGTVTFLKDLFLYRFVPPHRYPVALHEFVFWIRHPFSYLLPISKFIKALEVEVLKQV